MFRLISFVVIVALFIPCGMVAATPSIQYSQGKYRMRNCRIDARSPEDCDPDGYDILVWMHAGPAVFAAVVVFLVTFFYCIGKYVFDCCGGRKQSPNFCCPMRGVPAKYSKADLMRPLFLSVFVFAIATGACVWGCISVTRFKSNVWEMHNSVDLSIKQISASSLDFLSSMSIVAYDAGEDAERVVSLLDSLPRRAFFEKTFLSRSAVVFNLTKNIILGDPTMADIFTRVFYVICVVTAVLSAVGVVVAFCNLRRYISMSIFFFMALFAVLVWVSNGIFSATSFHMEKTCLEVFEFSHQRVNVLKALFECDDAVMQSHLVDLEEAFLKRARAVCEKVKPLCYDSSQSAEANIKLKQVLSCPLSMNCATATESDLFTWVRTSMYTASEIVNDSAVKEQARKNGYLCAVTGYKLCNTKACSTECTMNGNLSFVGKATKEFYTSVSSLVAARSVFDYTGRQVGNCNAVLATVIPQLYDPCDRAVSASVDLLESSGTLALTLVAAMFAYSMGAKRFIPLYKVQTPQSD